MKISHETWEEYRPEKIHWSALKAMANSPAEFLYWLVHQKKTTDAMALGIAVDEGWFEQKTPLIWDGHKRGSGKNSDGVSWDDFATEHGITDWRSQVLTRSTAEKVLPIIEALNNHPFANLLRESAIEVQQKREWHMKGFNCAGTPDLVGEDWIADLKVTNNVEPRRFFYHARQQGWIAQPTWYGSSGGQFRNFYLIGVGSAKPHEVVVYRYSDAMIDYANDHWITQLQRLEHAIETKSWPWRTDGSSIDFELPDNESTIVLDLSE